MRPRGSFYPIVSTVAAQVQATRKQTNAPFAFLPSDLSGLQVQLETGNVRDINCHEVIGGGNPCEDAEICLNWTDLSTNARNVTVAANGPTFQLADTTIASPGRMSRLVFDGTDDELRAATASHWKFLHDGTGMTFFCVALNRTATQNKPLLDTGAWDSGEGMQVWIDDGAGSGRASFAVRKVAGTVVVFPQTPASADVFPDNEWHCIAGDYVSGGPGRVFVDGAFVATAEETATPTANNPAVALGLCKAAGATFGAYDVAAVIAYNRVLAASEYRKVFAYLGQRYRLAVGNVACLGDSITAPGASSSSPIAYPTRLAQILGTLWRTTNFGVSGAVVNEAGAAADVYNDQWFHGTNGARRRRYNWMVCLAGINDIRADVEPADAADAIVQADVIFARYDDLLNEIIAEPLALLVLCTLLPTANSFGWTALKQAELISFNTSIRNYAAANPTTTYLVDLYQLFGSAADATKIRDEYDQDSLHPNQLGTDLIAAAIADKILSIGLL